MQRQSHPHDDARKLLYALPCLLVTVLVQSRNRFTNVEVLKCWFQWSSAFLRSQLKEPAILVFLALYFRNFKPLEGDLESSHGRKCKELGAWHWEARLV